MRPNDDIGRASATNGETGARTASAPLALLRGAPVSAEHRILQRLATATARPAAAVAAPGPSRAAGADPTAGGPRAERPEVAPDEATRRAEHEAALAKGRERGFELGLEEGRRKGTEEGAAAARQLVDREARAGREALASRLATLDGLLAALPGELDRRFAAAEDDLVGLAHAVICRVFGAQLVTAEGVAQLVRQAVREAGGHGATSIHLHPRDVAALEADQDLAAWMRQHAAGEHVQWVADERVALGGCLVRSTEGSLDARIETQLASLREVLLAARAGDAGRAGPTSKEGRAEPTSKEGRAEGPGGAP